MKMRVWYEYFTPKEAVEKKVIDLLKKYNVSIGLAFPPGSIGKDYAKILRKYDEQGIEVALWALLPDELGYWPSERNVVEFTDYVKRVFEWSDKEKFRIPEIAVDLEIPFLQMDAIKKSKGLEKLRTLYKIYRENRDMGRFYDSSRRFEELNEYIHSRGARTVCPVIPLIIEDVVTGGTALQDIIETPITTVNWDVLSVMIYTSMFTGYSKGRITKKDMQWYLYASMRDLKERYWERAGIAIGVTYVGKLGDEPYYSTPEELLPDMQAAKAALIEDITIYNLEGILRSPQPEAWFETLIACEPRVPERSLRVDAARAIAMAASRLL